MTNGDRFQKFSYRTQAEWTVLFDFRQILHISFKQKVWEYLQGYSWAQLFKGWITLSTG